MGRPYCQLSMANNRLPGCVRFPPSRHSDECGYNNSTPRPVSRAGERKRKAFHRPSFLTARRMTVRRVTPKSIQPREKTSVYRTEYRKRAGIEGTLSQGIRGYGLRRCRYLGEAKTHLQHVLTAAAINFVRVYNWLTDRPRAKTRTSTFSKLMGRPRADCKSMYGILR